MTSLLLDLPLYALIALPVVGALLAWPAARWHADAPRWVSLATLAALTLMTLPWLFASAGDASPWLAEFRAPWMPRFGIGFNLAMDGLAALLILLTAVLGLAAVLCSWREIREQTGFFHANLLLNLAGVAGVFLATDLMLFFICWEAMLVPMFLLILLWGHGAGQPRGRVYAAMKFFVFTQASGLLMLVAILAMGWWHAELTGRWSFEYTDWLALSLPHDVAQWLMLGFFVAFAVKLPAFPVHSWLPDAHSQAPTAGSVILAGVLLKTGAFGLIRYGINLFPEPAAAFAPVAMALGVAGILYGAALAMTQTDIKRFVAYTSVSHMGFVLLGAYAGTETALQGVMVLLLAHGLSTGALFILCGALYERLHTREFGRMGGIAARAPRYATALVFFSVASLGMPGTGNFIAEFLILAGSFPVAPWPTAVGATGLIVAAVYSLIVVQRVLHGPPADDAPVQDLLPRERGTLAAALLLLVALGLFPQPLIDAARPALATTAALLPAGDAR
nr:NADH-quinone oxidoreductase subunit M [Sinimarinibacterium flocculans]